MAGVNDRRVLDKVNFVSDRWPTKLDRHCDTRLGGANRAVSPDIHKEDPTVVVELVRFIVEAEKQAACVGEHLAVGRSYESGTVAGQPFGHELAGADVRRAANLANQTVANGSGRHSVRPGRHRAVCLTPNTVGVSVLRKVGAIPNASCREDRQTLAGGDIDARVVPWTGDGHFKLDWLGSGQPRRKE